MFDTSEKRQAHAKELVTIFDKAFAVRPIEDG